MPKSLLLAALTTAVLLALPTPSSAAHPFSVLASSDPLVEMMVDPGHGRGRLSQGILGAATLAVPATAEGVSAADFRASRTTPSILDSSQHALLGAAASAALEPLTWTATQTDAHQIDKRTLSLDGSPTAVRQYAFTGGRRTSDGVWTSTFDELGRVISIGNARAGRKIAFEFGPSGRVVGRTAYQADGSGGWSVETRSTVLAGDGLPAESTFVWDPIADRLVAVFAKGASTQPGAGPTAGLVRQILHGDQGYDDPLEMRIASTPGATPSRFFLVIDHAGTGSLQATLGADGQVVERVLYADSYGDAPRYLQGPVVDKISVDAVKTATGDVKSVLVRLHLSEKIAASTLAAGVRLASVKADRSTAFVAATTPVLDDDHTVLWTVTASDWSSLTTAAGADSIEVAVSTSLRGDSWGDAPVQSVPPWALQLYGGTDSTAANPVIDRESIDQLTSFIGTIAVGGTGSHTLYKIESLYLAAATDSKAKLLTGFQLAPFVEPANGMAFFRNRFFDPATGSWLTPDPMGTRDSSNLYAFAGADPVNGRDPSGLYDAASVGTQIRHSGAWLQSKVLDLGGDETGIGFVDAGNRITDLYMQTTINSVIGVGTNLAAGLFEIGSGTGRSLFAADWKNHPFRSYLGFYMASNRDAADTFLYGSGIGSLAEAPVRGVLNSANVALDRAIGSSLDTSIAFITPDLGAALAKPSPADLAASFQGYGRYKGVDPWVDALAPKGTLVYAGEPGVSGFFTTENGFLASGTDATAFNEGVQVGARHGLYRPGITVFEVMEDAPVAYSPAVANTQFGPGGFPQVYIPNWQNVLRPVQTYITTNRALSVGAVTSAAKVAGF